MDRGRDVATCFLPPPRTGSVPSCASGVLLLAGKAYCWRVACPIFLVIVRERSHTTRVERLSGSCLSQYRPWAGSGTVAEGRVRCLSTRTAHAASSAYRERY